jgi:hypothetical protein
MVASRARREGGVVKTTMRYLGVLRGSGSLACEGQLLGPVEFEIEGFLTRPGEIVGSGEIRMAPADLDNAFGRRNLRLTTDQGRVLDVRFSGKRNDATKAAAHADIGGDLPPADEWRR